MKLIGKLLTGIVLLSFWGCSNEVSNDSLFQECSQLKDAKILAEGEGCCAIFGAAVYRFEDELYTVQGFCSCDELFVFTTQNPTNCDGFDFCDGEGFDEIQSCLQEMKFFENAEFLYNITIE